MNPVAAPQVGDCYTLNGRILVVTKVTKYNVYFSMQREQPASYLESCDLGPGQIGIRGFMALTADAARRSA